MKKLIVGRKNVFCVVSALMPLLVFVLVLVMPTIAQAGFYSDLFDPNTFVGRKAYEVFGGGSPDGTDGIWRLLIIVLACVVGASIVIGVIGVVGCICKVIVIWVVGCLSKGIVSVYRGIIGFIVSRLRW